MLWGDRHKCQCKVSLRSVAYCQSLRYRKSDNSNNNNNNNNNNNISTRSQRTVFVQKAVGDPIPGPIKVHPACTTHMY